MLTDRQPPKKSSRFKFRLELGLKRLLFGLILIQLLVLGVLVFRGYRGVYLVKPIPKGDRLFKVEKGQSVIRVLDKLHQLDLAPKPYYVRLVAFFEGEKLVFKKGTYQLPEQGSAWDIVKKIISGQVYRTKVTLPEGLDKWDTARILSQSGLGSEAQFLALIQDPAPILDLDPDATDLEGYLYPETYLFDYDAAPAEVIAQLLSQFRLATKPHLERVRESGLSLRKWLAFASLIEKETAIGEERFTIAGVFHKRLLKGMLLQCDPTIIYSLKQANLYRGRIYKSQISYDSPYNTYVHSGLPPGPIASPSLDSLLAVLEPEENPYFYFVARDDGTHHFSRTLSEHNRAVAFYRRFTR